MRIDDLSTELEAEELSQIRGGFNPHIYSIKEGVEQGIQEAHEEDKCKESDADVMLNTLKILF